MKKLLIGISFLTLTVNASELTPQKIFSESVKSILCLRHADEKVIPCYGTGFFLKKGNEIFLVTNNHMVQDPMDVSKMIGISKDNRNYSGFRLLYTDPVADIAILKVPNSQEIDNYLELADSGENLVVGDDSYWIGHPGGLWSFTFSRGYVGKIEGNGNKYDLQMHGVGFHGSSGSPFLDKDGKVIGILATGSYKDETIFLGKPGEKKHELKQTEEYEGVSFGSSKESIIMALDKARNNYSSNAFAEINNKESDSTIKVSSEITKSTTTKNDLASLIRELKAYTPPEERKLGSL